MFTHPSSLVPHVPYHLRARSPLAVGMGTNQSCSTMNNQANYLSSRSVWRPCSPVIWDPHPSGILQYELGISWYRSMWPTAPSFSVFDYSFHPLMNCNNISSISSTNNCLNTSHIFTRPRIIWRVVQYSGRWWRQTTFYDNSQMMLTSGKK